MEQAHCKCVRKGTQKKKRIFILGMKSEIKNPVGTCFQLTELFSVWSVKLVTPEHN